MVKHNRFFLVIGFFSLFLGILGFILNQFLFEGNSMMAFAAGLFLGLSLVFNLVYLFRKGKQNQ